MSIIISIVSDKCGITASDGRKSSPAFYQNGQIITKSLPIDDSFNKTFELNNGKIIGAWAGLMEFEGKTIPEHLQEIYSTQCSQAKSITDILLCLTTNLRERLQNETTILFGFKVFDLIIIATESGKIKDLKNYVYRYKPNINSTQIDIEYETIPTDIKLSNIAYWKIFGDDDAQPHVNRFLHDSINGGSNLLAKTLVSIAYKAIRLGIQYSGKHPEGDHPSCGGKPFVRVIK